MRIAQERPATVLDNLQYDLDTMFVLFSAFLVFFMQCGFALLEAGTVRQKNVKNILLKNIIDVCIASMTWWAVGYAFSTGKCGNNAFIGYSNFFLADESYQVERGPNSSFWAFWLYSFAFSATTATIVSGAVAERLRFRAYLIYTAWMTGFVYPVVAHWVWSSTGWLSARRLCSCAMGEVNYCPLLSASNGLLDFAGGGVVHMVGGGASLVGALILGKRIGRYADDGYVIEFTPASPPNQILGTLILWFGWYGFNPGSTGCMPSCMFVAGKVAVNTTLSAGAAGLTTLLLAVVLGHPGDVGPVLNGILTGLVAITAGAGYVQAYGAVIIGIVAGGVYMVAAKAVRSAGIDDPLDASAVHYFGGMWGLLATGLFATETSIMQVYGYANDVGAFYGGNGTQFGVQLLGAVVISAWTFSLFGGLFLVLKLAGWLRVSREDEEKGLDVAQSVGTGMSMLPQLELIRRSMTSKGNNAA